MTALIGGLCVGALWGIWATRQLLKRRKDIKISLERRKLMLIKLETLHKQQSHGKQTTETSRTGTGTAERKSADSAPGGEAEETGSR